MGYLPMESNWKPKQKNRHPERDLQVAVCTYLKHQYPKLIFFSESSGMRTSIYQAKLLKATRSIGKLPDLFIAAPRREYHGLFIEIKTEDSSPFLKNGDISQEKHVQEQWYTLCRLTDVGYRATFGVGFNHIKSIIDCYLNI